MTTADQSNSPPNITINTNSLYSLTTLNSASTLSGAGADKVIFSAVKKNDSGNRVSAVTRLALSYTLSSLLYVLILLENIGLLILLLLLAT